MDNILVRLKGSFAILPGHSIGLCRLFEHCIVGHVPRNLRQFTYLRTTLCIFVRRPSCKLINILCVFCLGRLITIIARIRVMDNILVRLKGSFAVLPNYSISISSPLSNCHKVRSGHSTRLFIQFSFTLIPFPTTKCITISMDRVFVVIGRNIRSLSQVIRSSIGKNSTLGTILVSDRVGVKFYFPIRNREIKFLFLIIHSNLQRRLSIEWIIVILQQVGINFFRVNRHGISLGIGVVSTSRFCVFGLVTNKTAFLRKVPISFRIFTKCSRTYTRRKSIMHHTRRNTASNGFRNFLKHTVQCTSIVRIISMVTIRCNAIS